MDADRDVTRVSIIGCGNISSAYVNGCRQFTHLRVVSVGQQ